uniref:Uncharacterized protein n=1 Tax=Arundo donax TaxID=35708 RepID=A0A0A9QP18_ARUDO
MQCGDGKDLKLDQHSETASSFFRCYIICSEKLSFLITPLQRKALLVMSLLLQ